MILPKSSDAIHRAWLFRLLSALANNQFLVESLPFKGGTCAAMRGIVERFSVDLDFDVLNEKLMDKINSELIKIFNDLGLEIKDSSTKVPQFFLKYPNREGERNTLKFDATFPPPKANKYEPFRFVEIDRILFCQTPETMFANKLVTLKERFEKQKSIAGRDMFDIHTYFLKGFSYTKEVIEERRQVPVKKFFEELINFIEQHITQNIIDEDLNYLLDPETFQKSRKYLKQEVLMFLRQALAS